jgi:prepilin-type N-terminal cleavage/methylation domain-containing protein
LRKAFTLVEILVAIAILAILAAIMFSIVGGVKGRAAQTVCASNLGQLAKASLLYSDANDGMLALWDGDTGWVDKLVPLHEGALVCPVIGPLNQEPTPDPISDHGGYTQNTCLMGSTARVSEPSRTVLFSEAARLRSPKPNVVGLFQPLYLAGPDHFCQAERHPDDVFFAHYPEGEWGALRHAGGGLHAMVDGRVEWLTPTALRLPANGCGCQEIADVMKIRLKWKGPEDGPYFSAEPD